MDKEAKMAAERVRDKGQRQAGKDRDEQWRCPAMLVILVVLLLALCMRCLQCCCLWQIILAKLFAIRRGRCPLERCLPCDLRV